MSYPTASSPAPSSGSSPPPGGLQYLRSYNYIFENPEWTMVLLWGALMAFIPVVGPLVLIGYMFFVVDGLLESKGARYPVLDLNRFVDYLVRGLWPFLAAMIVSIVLIPVFIVLWTVVAVISMAVAGIGGEDAAPAAGILMMVLMLGMMLIVMALSIVLNIFMIPLLLRAGLSQDFVEAFKFDWIKEFVRKMWLETLLALLFLMLSSMVLTLVGYLACCIGVFFVQPLVFLAYAHILYQLYSLYLSRGGTPVYPKPKLQPPQPTY